MKRVCANNDGLAKNHGLSGMKLPVVILLTVLSFYPDQGFAQHRWPPLPVEQAPIMSGLTLRGNKFLPSSERWNLVWADQLVPGWISDAQVVFAARNYVATQKIFQLQLTSFESVNPNFLCVSYHLAAGLNPAMNADCPNPKNNGGTGFIGVVAPKGYVSEYVEYFRPWLALHSIDESGTTCESMFQHYDQLRKDMRVWHIDPYWLMNMNDDNWREYITETCLDWLAGNANQGMFFDVAVETSASLYNPNTSNPAPGNFNWWEDPHRPYGYTDPITTRRQLADSMNATYRGYFRHIYSAFHAGDTAQLVLPNVDQMITTVYDPLWLDGDVDGPTVDGVMIESFGRASAFDMYLTLERTVRHITAPGRILIAQSYPSDVAQNLRLVAMYMLIKNANSYINLLGNSGVEWYPEYEIDLGNQTPLPENLETMRVSGTDWHSLWKREYANGMVLCNTSDIDISYPIAGNDWERVQTSGGGPVDAEGNITSQTLSTVPVNGTVMIGASDCIILHRRGPNAVNQLTAHIATALEVFPNPASSEIDLFLSGKQVQDADVRIYNLLGIAQQVNPMTKQAGLNGAGRIHLDIDAYAPGLYIVVVVHGTELRTSRFLKQ